MAITYGDADTQHVKVFEGAPVEEETFAFLKKRWERRSDFDHYAAIQSKAWGLHTLFCMSRVGLRHEGDRYDNIELRQIYVEPEKRRQGHCRAMIKMLERVCERLQVKLLIFEVDNPHLQRYLEGEGYHQQQMGMSMFKFDESKVVIR